MDGHPYKAHRADKVEKSRVSHIAGHKHRASGGRATHKDEKQDRKLIGEMIHEHAEGKKAKHRRDKPMRAHGGKVKGKKSSNVTVNVNAAPHPSPMPPPPMMVPPPPMAPPGPPPGAGLGAPAPGGPPMPPPGMPPRKSGGRLTSDGHTAKPMRAKGGGVKSGPAWEEGKRLGTKVSHVPAKEPDIENMNRKRVVTFACGGEVKSFTARARGGKAYRGDGPFPGQSQEDFQEGKSGSADRKSRMAQGYARGGPVESNYKVAPATKLSGGAGGGIGRREKGKEYGGKPMKEVNGAR